MVSICEIGAPGGNFNSCQMFRENASGKVSTLQMYPLALLLKSVQRPLLSAEVLLKGKSAGLA